MRFFVNNTSRRREQWKMRCRTQFSSVQSLSCVWVFVTPWTAAHQASLSITNSWSLLRLMSVMPSNHLILCRPLVLLLSIMPTIRVFSNESALSIRWPKYFSFSISPSNKYSGLISFGMGCLGLLAVRGTRWAFSSTAAHKHQFFSAQLSLWNSSHIHTGLEEDCLLHSRKRIGSSVNEVPWWPGTRKANLMMSK